MQVGKLYRVTDHPHPSNTEFTGWGSLAVQVDVSSKSWIEIDCGEIVMWLGLRQKDTWPRGVFTVLYKDHGLCMIDVVWDMENLSKKLVLANTK